MIDDSHSKESSNRQRHANKEEWAEIELEDSHAPSHNSNAQSMLKKESLIREANDSKIIKMDAFRSKKKKTRAQILCRKIKNGKLHKHFTFVFLFFYYFFFLMFFCVCICFHGCDLAFLMIPAIFIISIITFVGYSTLFIAAPWRMKDSPILTVIISIIFAISLSLTAVSFLRTVLFCVTYLFFTCVGVVLLFLIANLRIFLSQLFWFPFHGFVRAPNG